LPLSQGNGTLQYHGVAMPSDAEPLDITDEPQLSRLADEVRRAERPQVWRRANQDVAMLIPLTHAIPTPPPKNPALAALLAKLPKDSVVARTAGALHTAQPFPGYDEEREAAAAAMALDYVARSER
jgi:hypothetical protein